MKKKTCMTILLGITLAISLTACGGNSTITDKEQITENKDLADITETPANEASTEVTQAPTEIPEENSAEETEESSAEESREESADNQGIRQEVKEGLNSYEEFMNEYYDYMKKVQDSPSDVTLLADYADYMKKYQKMAEKMDAMDDMDLNKEETAYYMDVQNRINKKLLELSE